MTVDGGMQAHQQPSKAPPRYSYNGLQMAVVLLVGITVGAAATWMMPTSWNETAALWVNWVLPLLNVSSVVLGLLVALGLLALLARWRARRDQVPRESRFPDRAFEPAAVDALTAFKDWSNYLLVTTVAAVGWIATDQTTSLYPSMRGVAAWFFCASIACGIFTLALVPLVREEIPKFFRAVPPLPSDEQSIYRIKPKFRKLWLYGKPSNKHTTLKLFCFPQHVFFIIGVLCYTFAKFGPESSPPPQPPALEEFYDPILEEFDDSADF